MNSMKKLSVLVALILCVTVGGVYATWNYAQNDVADQTQLLNMVMTEKKFSGAFGTYHINHNDVKFEIDQTANGNYTPKLNITGSIVVKFSPSENIPADVKENGYTSYVSFTNPTGANVYEGQNIFTLAEGDLVINDLTASTGEKWTKGTDGTFTYTITAEKLAEMISINTGAKFYLDTKGKYDAFNAVLTGVNMTLSDGITAASN